MNYWLFGNNPSNRNGWSEENDITKWIGWKYSLKDFQILNFEMAPLLSCRKIEKIFAKSYSAE